MPKKHIYLILLISTGTTFSKKDYASGYTILDNSKTTQNIKPKVSSIYFNSA